MKYATTFHQGFTEVQVNNDYLESLRYKHIHIIFTKQSKMECFNNCVWLFISLVYE